jgi:two-component system, cell cycle sensor histidine kinase and response regulator CckA
MGKRQTLIGHASSRYGKLEVPRWPSPTRARARSICDRTVKEPEAPSEALRPTEATYRFLAEHATDLICRLSPDGTFLYVSPASRTLLGYEPGELLGRLSQELLDPEDLARIARHTASLTTIPDVQKFTYRIRRKDGEYVWFETTSRTILNPGDGTLSEHVTISRDITERVQTEEALRESDARFRQLVENVQSVFYIVAAQEAQVIYVTPAFETVWGCSCDSLYQDPHAWTAAIHPDDRPQVSASRLQARFEPTNCEYRIVRPDGTVRWIRDRGAPVRNEAGEVYRVVGIAEDITAHRELEERLRQSQKLEAVGRLAGGVAHDFNNMLHVITGYCDLLLMDLQPTDPRYRRLSEIQKAADRAVRLTRQLLAFSRRQMLAPRVLDLNEVVGNLQGMLARLIGEDVRLENRLAPELDTVKADPGQIEQVIVNLAINARDAMPDGGSLSIETANLRITPAQSAALGVPPGRYVTLCVADSGCGIPADLLPHVFEPFFTTKETGKGTGLGLATVYGIIQQSGGQVRIESAPERGTRFTIYLPSLEDTAPAGSSVPAAELPPSGDGVILLVEDEAMVRELVADGLRACGYTVLEAQDARQALHMSDGYQGTIHLLVTDVVMPGGSGRQLAEELCKRRPDVKVLYITGYTDDTVIRHGVPHNGLDLLQKPFTPAALARKAAEMLSKPIPG